MNFFEGYKDKAKKTKKKVKGAAESQKLFLQEGGTGFSENPVTKAEERRRKQARKKFKKDLDDDEEFDEAEFEEQFELDEDEQLAKETFNELF